MRHTITRVLALLVGVAVAVPFAPQAIAQQGQWANGPNLPYFPTHVHLLPNGTVMMWPGDGVSGDDPRRWDPGTGSVTTLPKAGYDLFCSGHSFLADGRLFVIGGHRENNIGLAETAIYDPAAEPNLAWKRLPPMNEGRWYPTSITLANGDVLALSGDRDRTLGVNPLPQVWQAASSSWRTLTGANLNLPLYPYMFLAPNGKAFNAGPDPSTRYLDTAGTGSWSSVLPRSSPAVYRSYGGAVMYAPGKILVMGGGDPPTNTAEVIDLNEAAPSWRAVGSMTFARRQLNATVLPDGKVLVTGGTSGSGFNNDVSPVLAAELWNPDNGSWTVMSKPSIRRIYHSTAMLLADGRVLTTGGNGYTQTEIFSPSYLSAGLRPTIASAPSAVTRGQSFFVNTPDAASVTDVSWMRLPSVTHTNTMSQGFVRSASLVRHADKIEIVAPDNPTLPDGPYLLFLLRNGVPSQAKVVQLGLQASPANPAPVLGAISPVEATAGGSAFTLTVSGSNFINSSQVLWNGSYRITTYASANQLTASILSSDLAAATTAQVTVFNPAPGGGTSAAKSFTVKAATASNPVPSVSAITPNNRRVGGPAFKLTVNGTNFVSSSKVLWNGTERATTYQGPSVLSASIAAADIAAVGTANVTVTTPGPGGGTTAPLLFRIKR